MLQNLPNLRTSSCRIPFTIFLLSIYIIVLEIIFVLTAKSKALIIKVKLLKISLSIDFRCTKIISDTQKKDKQWNNSLQENTVSIAYAQQKSKQNFPFLKINLNHFCFYNVQ